MKIKKDDIPWRPICIASSILLIAWVCVLILWPFSSAILLALILVVATWPAFAWLEARLGGRAHAGAAAGLMTLCLASFFLFPFGFAAITITKEIADIKIMLDTATAAGHLPIPAWLSDIPFVSPHIEALWPYDITQLTQSVLKNKDFISFFLLEGARMLISGITYVAIALFLAFFMFWRGDALAIRLKRLAMRFTGPQGQHLLKTCHASMVGVIYGILGAAGAQSLLVGIGFALTGVPGPAIWGAITFVVSFLPMGTPLVWGPGVFWLISQGHWGAGAFLFVWGVVTSSVDNIIRPYCISTTTDLPFVLIFLGILGGLMAFGLLGLFIGPVTLTLAYTIIHEASNPPSEETAMARSGGLEPPTS